MDIIYFDYTYMELNKIYNKIIKSVLSHNNKKTKEGSLFGLYEATTKLHVAVFGKKEKEEIEMRIANTLIGVCDVAEAVGIKNIEDILFRRVKELGTDLRK